jgi:predicted ArsR family transcriptional regulator
MSPSRARVLDLVAAQSEPTTLAALVIATGLHANTVREHLEALTQDGLVTRSQAPRGGRGRPAWRYEATGAAAGTSEYAGLAAALAAAVERTSDDPAAAARVAGSMWGRELARSHGRPATGSAAAARREVVAILDEVGFEPRTDATATTVRLTRCPLLEAAHRSPEVVCSVHLGLVSGALEEYDTDPEGTDLVPFAEPGACLLHLAARRRTAASGGAGTDPQ